MKQVNDFFQTKSRESSVFDRGKFFKDKQGNTVLQAIKYHKNSNGNLVFSSYEVLLDKTGKFHDYAPIGSLVDEGRFGKSAVTVTHFFSNDFKRDVIISTSGGVFVAELKADYSIKNYFKGRPARVLAEINARQFLVINERGVQFLIDRQGNETNLNNTFSGSNGNVAGFSQLIQKNGTIWFATPSEKLGRYNPESGFVSYDDIGREFEKFNFISDKEIALVDEKFGLYIYDLTQKNSGLFYQTAPH